MKTDSSLPSSGPANPLRGAVAVRFVLGGAGCSLQLKPLPGARVASASAYPAIDAAPGNPQDYWEDKEETVPPPLAAAPMKRISELA